MQPFKKFTIGFVTQNFDENGNCISQEFIAGESEYEIQEGEPTDPPENEKYFPFEMKQPGEF